ncbi:DNA replication/repair protein RecF [Maricurvus nonylphenolicus]|uniref:DNA replication/repair protein RecF n=1 Tax=Maricurvus nonylphenolicus TaxID=1008307 RepID=UPI0036F24089
MSLKRLSVQNLRNLSYVDLELAEHLNIIYGANGSGKTSLLEAISVLSLGRSFRSRKIKSLIKSEQEQLTVFGRLVVDGEQSVEMPVGVSRDRQGGGQIKVDGCTVSSASQLTEHLPLQIMNGHSFQLLEGAPQVRRQFMDWLVFHVEPGFLSLWKDVQKLLKQRNSVLRRDKIDPLLLAPWDKELAVKATQLDQMRQQVFDRFLARFKALVEDFIAIDGLMLSYYRGWDREQSYSECLEAGLNRDIDLGYTRVGPHRADIRIGILKQPAAEVLSRGQQKLLVSALRIAQGAVFQEITGRRCVYLIDDLPAELDSHYREVLAGWLDRLQSQVFVTGVERDVLISAWPVQSKERTQSVFHVEHGMVTTCETAPVDTVNKPTEYEVGQ